MWHCRGIDRGECDRASVLRALFPNGGGHETEQVDVEARVVNAYVVKAIGKAEFGKRHKLDLLLDSDNFDKLVDLEQEALSESDVDMDGDFRSFVEEDVEDETDAVLVAQANAIGIARAVAVENTVVLLDANGKDLKREPANGTRCVVRVYATGYNFENEDGDLQSGAKLHLVGLKTMSDQPEPLMNRKAAYNRAQAVKKQGKLDAFRKDFGA